MFRKITLITMAVVLGLAVFAGCSDTFTDNTEGTAQTSKHPPYWTLFDCEVNWYDINPPDPVIAPYAGYVDWWVASDPNDPDTYDFLERDRWSKGAYGPMCGLHYNHGGSGYIMRRGTLVFSELGEEGECKYEKETQMYAFNLSPGSGTVFCEVRFDPRTSW